MIINHNLNSMNAHRNMSFNTAQTGKAMEKLSSGLRINRAGDDAAGLAISEKMRGQIRGLDQASRNAQDGISLIQTAEGALNETHSILQRMRELGVQSSNDTNTSDDRNEIQKEMDQLKAEIDRIGNNTEFNTKSLVDGSQSQKATLDGVNAAGLVSVKAINSLDEDTYSVEVLNSSAVAANFNDSGTGVEAVDITLGAGADIGDGFKVVVTNSNGTTADITLQDKDGNQLGATVTGHTLASDLTIDQVTIAGGSIATNGEATFDFGMEADYTVSKAGVAQQTLSNVVSTTGKVEVGGLELTVDNTLTDATSDVEIEGKALQFQVGANENQSIRLSMGDMRAAALGVSSITVDSHENAKSAVTTIDAAIRSVSGERSKLGALQNRLEHTINNLNVGAENLQAAESRIRDVDMAKEMMNFTKNNILNQAAQAMMSQSNQQPQAVLQLLR